MERTYSDARPEHIWDALFVMNELFRKVARPTGEAFGFAYPEREDTAVSLFLSNEFGAWSPRD